MSGAGSGGRSRPRAAAVVLAGGAGARMGGEDKPQLLLGQQSLVARAEAALRAAGCDPVLVVGRETGGGPVAALASALPAVRAERVVVFAGDLVDPAAAAAALTGGAWGPDGALLVDPKGREQWLAAVYRVGPLLERIAELAAENPSGTVDGLPMRALVGRLDLARVPTDWEALADIDTWEDYRRAKERFDG